MKACCRLFAHLVSASHARLQAFPEWVCVVAWVEGWHMPSDWEAYSPVRPAHSCRLPLSSIWSALCVAGTACCAGWPATDGRLHAPGGKCTSSQVPLLCECCTACCDWRLVTDDLLQCHCDKLCARAALVMSAAGNQAQVSVTQSSEVWNLYAFSGGALPINLSDWRDMLQSRD